MKKEKFPTVKQFYNQFNSNGYFQSSDCDLSVPFPVKGIRGSWRNVLEKHTTVTLSQQTRRVLSKTTEIMPSEFRSQDEFILTGLKLENLIIRIIKYS